MSKINLDIYRPTDSHRKQFKDIDGSNYVIVEPKKEEDIPTILKLANSKKLQYIVKSGVYGTKRKDATGKIIINLSRWKKILEDKDTITALAGTTIWELAKFLRVKKLWIPLPSNGTKTVSCAVTGNETGIFPMSSGKFSDWIVGCNGYDASGEKVQLKKFDAKKIAVIVSITFKKQTAREFHKKKIVVSHASKPLKQGDVSVVKTLGKLLNTCKTDIFVEIQNEIAAIPMITVLLAGKDKAKQEKNLLSIFKKTELTSYTKTNDIIEVMAGNQGVVHFKKHPGQKKTIGSFSNGLDILYENVGDILKNGTQILLTAQRINQQNTYEINVLSNVDCKKIAKKENQEFFTYASTTHKSLEKSLVTDVWTTLKDFVNPQPTSIKRTLGGTSSTVTLPSGFRGQLVIPDGTDDPVLDQYATSSYGLETKQHRMLPAVVGYPVDAKDVDLMVQFAKANSLKVVARSGGHQYCGLSSGGADTILLVMDNLQTIDKDTSSGTPRAILGPGCRLRNIAKQFKAKDWKMTVPHGECPLVGIGGHCQTGGFGHLLRSFGLCLDYIYGFEIVTANAGILNISRDSTDAKQKQLFTAVCGGGPGGFGIITKIIFQPILDIDHPKSCSYQGYFWYSKALYLSLITEVQKWTAMERKGTLPQGVDLMSTVYQKPLSLGPLAVDSMILIEYVAITDVGRKWMEGSIARIGLEVEDVNPKGIYDPMNNAKIETKGLSEINYQFVRPLDNFVKQGREFNIPYEKRLSCTNNPLTDSFVTNFVNLVDETIQTDGLRMVFQMTLGGGQYAAKGSNGNNLLAHRDASIGIVYDVFYKENNRYAAIEKQLEFGRRVSPTLGTDVRMQWGSFGHEEEITMSHTEVQGYYYGNQTLYRKLQKIKKDWDPSDIFHSQFTPTLPNTDTTWVHDEGKLILRLDKGKNLPDKDWGWLNNSDPFFNIYLETKKQSHTVDNTSNPDYEGEEFILDSWSLASDVLTLVCWDSDVAGFKEYMCSNSISLKTLVKDNSVNATSWTSVTLDLYEESTKGVERKMFQEVTTQGKQAGSISFRVKYIPTPVLKKK